MQSWCCNESLQWRHNEWDGVSNHRRLDFCSTVCSGLAHRKHQSSASMAFEGGIHRWPVNSPHKGPVTRKMFPVGDVIIGCISVTTGPQCGALMFSVLLVWMTCYVNRQVADGLRRCDDHVTSKGELRGKCLIWWRHHDFDWTSLYFRRLRRLHGALDWRQCNDCLWAAGFVHL